ncbi:MAG: SLC13 family permease, partial [Terriglobia bacterium]
MLATLIIFAAAYAAIAIGRLPGFPISRASAAVVGAVAMIAVGTLSLHDAFLAIDYNTIALLFGMMVVVAFLRLSGVFRLAGASALKHTNRPIVLLIVVVGFSGVLSAFLVNDAVCLAFTPLVLDVASDLRRSPAPYLLALAMAANVGSCSTITGNPQNMIIGSASGIRYPAFAAALSPVAAAGLVLVVVVIVCFFRNEFRLSGRFTAQPGPGGPVQPVLPAQPLQLDRSLIWKPVLATVGMVVFFFLGLPPAVVALVAAAFLLCTQRANHE